MRSRSSAFTLIELLVVISLIVLLIAILLPALAQAAATGRAAACASVLRQFGIANAVYAADFDDLSLPAVDWTTLGSNGKPQMRAWVQNPHFQQSMSYDRTLNPAAGGWDWQLDLLCPDATFARRYVGGPGKTGNMNYSWGYNVSPMGFYAESTSAGHGAGQTLYDTATTVAWAYRLHDVRHTASAAQIMDAQKWDLLRGRWNDYVGEHSMKNGPAYRHPGERFNALFLDGHVERRERSAAFPGAIDAPGPAWQFWNFEHTNPVSGYKNHGKVKSK